MQLIHLQKQQAMLKALKKEHSAIYLNITEKINQIRNHQSQVS